MNPKRRAALHQRAMELVDLAAASDAELCICGRTRGEHDIAPDFTQPCEESGCKDFNALPVVEISRPAPEVVGTGFIDLAPRGSCMYCLGDFLLEYGAIPWHYRALGAICPGCGTQPAKKS